MRKEAKELKLLLKNAEEKINVGDIYSHYKNPKYNYKIKNLVIIEQNDEVGVIYECLYVSEEHGDMRGIEFIRPLDEFLEVVEVEGKLVQRFSKVKTT